MTPLILQAVEIRLGERPLFTPISLHIEPGCIAAIVGPSGSGKSTLLSHLCGALPPAFSARGEVRLGDRRLDGLPPEQRGLGVLFQDALLFPHMSVGGNLAYGLRPGGRRAERLRRIEAALDAVGLSGMAARDPDTLSGGQRARVALLRVLLSDPQAILLDEPFSRLDADTRLQTREWVYGQIRARGLPALLVTHDPDDVAAAGGPLVDIAQTAGEL
jgi:putative thiamine transport system ATP-binding protein